MDNTSWGISIRARKPVKVLKVLHRYQVFNRHGCHSHGRTVTEGQDGQSKYLRSS
jgi:hypothetical protein